MLVQCLYMIPVRRPVGNMKHIVERSRAGGKLKRYKTKRYKTTRYNTKRYKTKRNTMEKRAANLKRQC